MTLIDSLSTLSFTPFESRWISPSNIAFVKYWGKKGQQLPANPSLSMTLKECVTESKVSFLPSDNLEVSLFLEGSRQDSFAFKIKTYLQNLGFDRLKVHIETKNTFPHGAGIASSASGLSAFALCLTDYLYHLKGKTEDQEFMQSASHLARLASGSACRSVYGGFNVWGESKISHDLYTSQLSLIHSDFFHLQDTVLVINEKEKDVSSTQGHAKMGEHFFAEARFIQARNNFDKCLKALASGDIESLGQVLESEALSLHAMMLTSPEAFTLLKPKTLTAIEMIWDFRRQGKLPLYFTLDAGPNLHLIYPESYKNKIYPFIQHELAPLAVNVIYDERGEGPIRC